MRSKKNSHKKANFPKVSVLISIYNEEQHLFQCIRSVLNQSFSNFELILINDGSDDRSLQIIKSFNDNRIRILNNRNNLGLTKSLNLGLAICRGDYIARLDGSDLMSVDRLEKQLDYLNNNPKVAVIGSYFKCINDAGEKIDEINWPSDVRFNIFRLLYGENPVGHPGVLMRKNIIMECGMYREKFEVSQDIDLWLRIYLQGYLLDNIPEYLTSYRINPYSISNTFRKKQILNHRQAFHEFYNTLTKNTDQNAVNQYLNNLLFRSKVICKSDLNNIISIFTISHFRLTEILKINKDNRYFYNLLFDTFKMKKFIRIHLYKILLNYFPNIMNLFIKLKI